MDLREFVRDVPDFPKRGIMFKDITPILHNPTAFRYATIKLASHFIDRHVDLVVGVESRGFLIGAPLAHLLDVGFAPARKKGKLPWKRRAAAYQLEYGVDAIEMHEDAVGPGQNVLVVDDLLATGGTAQAVCKLVDELGGRVTACAFIIELSFLNGRGRLAPHEVVSLVQYEGE